ncbi:MAG: hypothetical protein AMXMBFR13_03610 [Phycisphaerae bacterium]
MWRQKLSGAILITACGCTVHHEVDLRQYEDFDWDRVVHVTIVDPGPLGGWSVQSIELNSSDGRSVRLVPHRDTLEALLVLKVTSTQTAP